MSDEKRIIVIGDSIARGASFDESRSRYVTIKENVLNILKGRLKAIFDCYAKFGCTIGSAYDALVIKLKNINSNEKPEYAAIEIGGNDSDFDWPAIARNPHDVHLPKTPLPQYKTTLMRMLDTVYSQGINPVLINLPPIDADKFFNYFTQGSKEMGDSILKWLGQIGKIYWWHERYNAALEHIGSITGTPVINIRQAFLDDEDYRKFICYDGIHPNADGYELMADAILDYVNRRQPTLIA